MRKNNYIWVFIIILLLFLIWFLWYFFVCNPILEIKEKNITLELSSMVKIDYKLSHSLSKVKWISMDSNVATVDDNGVVTATGYGNTTIQASVGSINQIITVSVFNGDVNNSLKDVAMRTQITLLTDEEISIPVVYNPFDAYVYSVNYQLDREGIVAIDNNKIRGLSSGTVNLTVIVNNEKECKTTIKVLDKNIPRKEVTDVLLNDNKIYLSIGDFYIIDYSLTPVDAYIYDIKWSLSNNDIVELKDGVIIGKKNGNAKINMTVNNTIYKEIDVLVSDISYDILLHSHSQIITKVGVQDKVLASVLPNDVSQKLIYTSSNPQILEINEDGQFQAKSQGNGTIIVKTSNGKKEKIIPFIVHPKNGVINGNGGIWEYNSSKSFVPLRAESSFFNNLVKNGKGTISGNKYNYNSYSYDINQSTLYYNGKSILMRFYYPPNVDLSQLNTFTFLGGTGERNFGGYFQNIDSNPSILKSSGIQILISARTNEGYDSNMVIACTNFVKEIINQNPKAMNNVGGYSLGGPDSGSAAEKGNYQKLLIFDSYFSNISENINLKNKEIIFYSPVGDAMLDKTRNALDYIKSNGTYKNVILVTNNNELISRYQDVFLIINPGDTMGRGHGNNIITNAHYFMYGCG